MNRVCPTCKQDLGTIGNYYCFKCGTKLPTQLTTVDVRMNKYGSVVPEFTTKNELNKKAVKKVGKYMLAIPIGLAIATAVYFFLFKGGILTSSQNSQKGSQTDAENRVIPTTADLPQTIFGERALTNFVPSTADIYVEGKNLSIFLDQFTNIGEDASLLGTSFKVSQIDDLIETQYAIFSKLEKTGDKEERVWALISKSKNEESVKTIVEATKEATWSARLIDGYVVVSNSKVLFDEVSDAKDKVILNLSLNSKFAMAKNSLPTEGKLFVLLLTDSAQESLKELSEENFLTTKFREVSDAILSKDKTSYVVD